MLDNAARLSLCACLFVYTYVIVIVCLSVRMSVYGSNCSLGVGMRECMRS